MPTLLAVERFLAPHRYSQDEVSRWVKEWLQEEGGASARLLAVYASAGVKTRASVVPIEEVFCAAAGAVDEAAIVTSDPARFPETCGVRTLSPAEAVSDMSVHAGVVGRVSDLPPSALAGGPAVQGWSP